MNSDLRLCPACHSAHARHRGEKYGFGITACLKCDTQFVSHLPESDNAQDYDDYYSPENLVTPAFVGQRLDEVVTTFVSHRQNNRLLDVGFGAGDLLRAAVRAGWEGEGIEVSLPAVEHARAQGLNVRQGELTAANYPDDSFDVVTAVEVLEHVPDPRQIVREIARILRPGGLFWATTPHGRGLSARLLKMQWSVVSPPEHLQLLSVKGARGLLTDNGFSSVTVATQGVNSYEIMHTLRARNKVVATSRHEQGDSSVIFSRNETGCRLNEFLVSSPSRRALKNAANRLLSVSRLGDSLKIRAVL